MFILSGACPAVDLPDLLGGAGAGAGPAATPPPPLLLPPRDLGLHWLHRDIRHRDIGYMGRCDRVRDQDVIKLIVLT